MNELYEVAGNMHMHTPYSDGMKWHDEIAADAIKAGLDFIIVTDHNIWVDGLEGYYETDAGKVLLIVGEEVHNVRRRPQASHCLIYGAERELAPCAPNPQELIDAAKAAGGYTFLAHPHEYDVPIVGEPNLGWHDWEINGFTGLEIWNYLSCFKNRLAENLARLPLQHKTVGYAWAVYQVFRPERYIDGPEAETLALWDELLAQGKRIVAIGNSDAHGEEMNVGPLKRVVYPYEYLFRAVNTHLLLPRPLQGDVAHDKEMILNAIGRGNAWVAYDLPHSTRGFRFSGHGRHKGHMGDEIPMDMGATLQVRTPIRAHIRLLRYGELIAEIENETHLTYLPQETGAYRVECKLPFMGNQVGWIYSNPIYLI